MDLRLYDTLTGEKRPFVPIDPARVRMYVCGPTVYDFAHIGNARPVIVFDVLFRLLKYLAKLGVWDNSRGETEVIYVRNITDVDDKINARAVQDYPGLPLNEAIRKVTEVTANQFEADVAALGSLSPTFEPRATDFVLPRSDGRVDMKSLIQELLDRNNAYVAAGNEGREVLFDVSSMSDYGALSKRKLDEQLAGARVAVDFHKKNAEDFVLWKESGAKQPGWKGEFASVEFVPDPKSGYEAEFTISREDADRLQSNSRVVTIHGRPGWHIECSAMSAAYLGKTFDIHGGGLDLIFPHHENEIAQSRCAHGTPFMANVWMHNGFLEVEGEKMSKSLGNFITIRELLADWPGEVLRLNMLKTHYRSPINWTLKGLEESARTLVEWHALLRITNDDGSKWDRSNREIYPPIIDALCDDLNTAKVVAELHGLRNALVHGVGERNVTALGDALNFLGLFNNVNVAAAINRSRREKLDEAKINELISARTAARARKDFTESDRIRDELAAMGVAIKDSKDGTTWEVAR